MYKVAMIGEKDNILGFKALGIEVFPVDDATKAQKMLTKLAQENYGVIFITEDFAKDIMVAIEKYNSMIYPAVIPVPGSMGSYGLGMKRVRACMEKAIGADILFKDQ